uniref:DUF834 domain-containing protein n=1 Tax=Oryza meridionalis TaxID=40149 RepID=A0A0E0C4Z0_9ORYZ
MAGKYGGGGERAARSATVEARALTRVTADADADTDPARAGVASGGGRGGGGRQAKAGGGRSRVRRSPFPPPPNSVPAASRRSAAPCHSLPAARRTRLVHLAVPATARHRSEPRSG